MKSRRNAALLFFIFIVSFCVSVSAHPGGVDQSGGHKDKKNVSGLGSYHYHCDGHPEHLHGPSGLCPYSKAYESYKANVDKLLAYMKKAGGDSETPPDHTLFSQEDISAIQTLLLSEHMPFKLTQALLESEETQYAKTNVKGLNVRKKPSTKASKALMVNVTGTPVLIKKLSDDGWCEIQVLDDNKSREGFVQIKMLNPIEKSEYFASIGSYFLSLKGRY